MADSDPLAGVDVGSIAKDILVERHKPSPLQQAYDQAADGKPDQVAKVRQLSEHLGEDPSFVHEHLEDAQAASDAKHTRDLLQQIEGNKAITASYLSKPENMAVAHDDVPNLVRTEGIVNQMHAASSMYEAAMSGAQSSFLGMAAREKLPNIELPHDAPMHYRFAAGLASFIGDAPLIAEGSAMGFLFGGFAGGPFAPITAPMGAMAGGFALPAATKEVMRQEYMKGDIKNAADLISRSIAVMKQGTKSGIVGAGAGLVGEVAAPFGVIAKLGAETTAMEVGGAAVEGKMPTAKGALDTGLQLAFFHGLNFAQEKWIDSQRMEAEQRFYGAMENSVKGSKLYARLPEDHQQFLKQLTGGTPVENVHIPIDAFERYFQGQNINPNEIAKDLGVSESYKESQATGNDLKVPLSSWMGKLVKDGHAKALAPDVKFREDGLTPNQVKDRNAAVMEQMQQEQSDAAEQIQADPEKKAGYEAIQQDIQNRMKQIGYLAGKKNQDKALESNAKLIASHYVTEGTRRNVDPTELYRRDMPMIYGEGQNVPSQNAVNLKLIHHGETAFDSSEQPTNSERLRGVLADHQTHGPNNSDEPLISTGRQQARELAQSLKGINFTKLMTGPSTRTRETVKHVGRADSDARFSGIDVGAFSGVPVKEFAPKFKAALDEWSKNPEAKVPGFNETFSEFQKRNMEGMADLMRGTKAGDNVGLGLSSDSIQLFKLVSENQGKPLEGDIIKRMAEKEKIKPVETTDLRVDPRTGMISPVAPSEDLTFQEGYPRLKGYDEGGGEGPRSEAGPSPLEQPLQGLPKGAGPTPAIRQAAKLYTERAGIHYREQAEYAKADPDRGRRIAEAFDSLRHDPANPLVKSAYKALIKETTDQFQVLKDMGLKIESIKPGQENPYKSSADMIADVRGGHLWFFPTDQGFGTDTNLSDHPLFEMTDEKLDDGTKLRANDLFRVVHDFFGHAKEGVGFGPNGEENAWNSHVRMYSPEAAMAMTTETRGQNSWVNFGPFGEANRENPENTHYADQKAGLLPGWATTEGMAQNREVFGQGELGYFDAKQKAIKLFANADPSTMMHESAHAWLKSSFDFVKSGAADEAYLKHWADAKDWLKITDDQSALTRDQQEKFAQGFENYLMKGEAPSEGLRGVFAKFQRWLTDVYRGRAPGAEVSPQAKAFMDRMLASDQEIENASKDVGYEPSEIQNIEGLDPQAQQRHRTLQERAHEQAMSQLLQETMKEFSRENEGTIASERERLRKESEAGVMGQPVFRAEQDLKDMLPKGTDIKDLADKYVLNPESVDDESSAHLEATAELNGYKSGHDLAQQLSRADFEGEVRKRVEEGMGPITTRERDLIRAKALDAIHNDKSLDLMAYEGQILKSLQFKKEVAEGETLVKRAQARADAIAAKDQAEKILASKDLKEASGWRAYANAEKNAAMRVSSAIAKGQMDKAAGFKQQQLLNHALAAQAYKNANEIERTQNFISKFDDLPGDLMKMPYAFGQHIHNLLVNAGMREPLDQDMPSLIKMADSLERDRTNPEVIANKTGLVRDQQGRWRKEELPEFVSRINENNYAMQLPDSVMSDKLSQRMPQMTFQELRDLKQALKTLNTIGRKFDNFLSFDSKATISDAASEFAKKVDQIGKPYAGKPKIADVDRQGLLGKLDAIKKTPDSMISDKVNLLTLSEYLDQLDPDGPAKNYIYRPLRAANDVEVGMRKESMNAVEAIREKHFTEKEFAEMSNKIVASVDVHNEDGTRTEKLRGENVLTMMMNWGNEGNRDRVTRGFGLSADDVTKVFNQFATKKHWDFVQDVWDHLDSYWPQIRQLEMDAKGMDPERVQPSAVDTPWGQYKGGYYPLAYDPKKSIEASKTVAERNELYKKMSPAAAHTDQGHAQMRVESLSRPVRLDYNVLFNHLDDVIHDLAYRRSVIDVGRFLRNPDVKDSIVKAVDNDGYRKVQDDLKNVASYQGNYPTPLEQKLRWFRFANTFATLGFRMAIFPRRISEDVLNSVREVGPVNLTQATKDFVMNPGDTRDFVRQNSQLMAERQINRERDLMDMSKRWLGKEPLLQQYAYLQDTIADQAMSYPVWSATYKTMLNQYGPEKARQIADESIIKTFGSGQALDQVGAQRGSELNKLISSYYSWHSMMFNRAWLQGKMAGLEYDRGNIGKALATMASATAFSWVLPAANEIFWGELMRNVAGGQGNEDEDAKKKRMLGKALEVPFSYFPLGRSIAAYGIPQVLGEHTRNFQMSPTESALETVVNAAAHTAKKSGEYMFSGDNNFDQKYLEEIARSATLALHFPQQINTWAFNFVDYLRDGEGDWRDMISRRVKK